MRTGMMPTPINSPKAARASSTDHGLVNPAPRRVLRIVMRPIVNESGREPPGPVESRHAILDPSDTAHGGGWRRLLGPIPCSEIREPSQLALGRRCRSVRQGAYGSRGRIG